MQKLGLEELPIFEAELDGSVVAYMGWLLILQKIWYFSS